MEDLHLLRPWWLLAALPWLALCWRLCRRDAQRGGWGAVCDEALLPFVLEGGTPGRRSASIALLALAGILASVALAGPAWRELPQPVYRQLEPLVAVLDLSRSMDAVDLPPSRIDRARRKIRDLLRLRRDGQTALVVFAGDAFAVTPLTDDVNTIDALVPSLGSYLMPLPGTRTDRGLEAAAALLEQAGARDGRVLLIADGVAAPGMDAAIARLTASGHRLSVIGVGTPEGGYIPAAAGQVLRDAAGEVVVPHLDEAALRAVALAGNGRYARLSVDDRDLEHVLADAGPRWSSVTDVPGLASDRWREEGPWLLLALLPLAALAFRRGLLVLAAAALLPLPGPAQALDWPSPWRTADQHAARAFEEGDYARAADAFRDPRWKAAALYRAGRFEEAAAATAALRDPEALYNRGNALARLGRLDEARALYEQVLRARPEHADARHNLALVRARQEREQRQEPGGGDADDSQPAQRKPGDSDGGSPQDRPRGEDAAREGGDAPPQGEAGDASRSAAGSTREAGPPPGGAPPEDPQAGDDATPDEPRAGEDAVDPDAAPAAAGEGDPGAAAASEQAMSQWLRQIDDDPGTLLRRKFRYQYGRRARGADAVAQPW